MEITMSYYFDNPASILPVIISRADLHDLHSLKSFLQVRSSSEITFCPVNWTSLHLANWEAFRSQLIIKISEKKHYDWKLYQDVYQVLTNYTLLQSFCVLLPSVRLPLKVFSNLLPPLLIAQICIIALVLTQIGLIPSRFLPFLTHSSTGWGCSSLVEAEIDREVHSNRSLELLNEMTLH